MHLPRDGQTNPVDTTQALAKGARNRGARILENVEVTDIIIEKGHATGVKTAKGDMRAEYVVNCAGMWARDLGAKAGTTLIVICFLARDDAAMAKAAHAKSIRFMNPPLQSAKDALLQ